MNPAIIREMEAEMSGSAFEEPESFEGTFEESQQTNASIKPETGTDPVARLAGGSEPKIPAEEFSIASERISNLSSGLMEVLADLERIIRASAEQLDAIQSAIDLKTSELKRLRNIDVAAETLEQLLESQCREKERFQARMESERRAWEEEKTRREQEEKAYTESLKAQRQLEEGEYRRTWNEEKLKAQQQFEEELRLIQQENKLKQEAVEKDLMERELVLKEKELEWAQLVQELEQFMSKLVMRTQPRTSG
jgi:hypothetical protein